MKKERTFLFILALLFWALPFTGFASYPASQYPYVPPTEKMQQNGESDGHTGGMCKKMQNGEGEGMQHRHGMMQHNGGEGMPKGHSCPHMQQEKQ